MISCTIHIYLTTVIKEIHNTRNIFDKAI